VLKVYYSTIAILIIVTFSANHHPVFLA